MRARHLHRADIMAIIPHRPPFLLIDAVVDLVPGERAVGLMPLALAGLTAPPADPPSLSPLIVVEALAQTAAVMALSASDREASGAARLPLYLISIDRAWFPRRPGPYPSPLRLAVARIGQWGPVWRFRGHALAGERRLASVTLTATISSAAGGARVA